MLFCTFRHICRPLQSQLSVFCSMHIFIIYEKRIREKSFGNNFFVKYKKILRIRAQV